MRNDIEQRAAPLDVKLVTEGVIEKPGAPMDRTAAVLNIIGEALGEDAQYQLAVMIAEADGIITAQERQQLEALRQQTQVAQVAGHLLQRIIRAPSAIERRLSAFQAGRRRQKERKKSKALIHYR